MKHLSRIKVTKELFNDPVITDERIFRDALHKLMEDVPIGKLGKIFKFNKIDPDSEESRAKLINPDISGFEKEEILRLGREGTIVYEIKLVI